MTCEEYKDAIGLFVMDALDPADQEAVRAHLASGCPSCSGYLAEVESVLALLPLALAPGTASPGLRTRLLERIGQSRDVVRDERASTGAGGPAQHSSRFRDALIGGALAAGIAALAVWLLLNRDASSVRRLRDHIASHDREIAALQSSVQDANETIRMLQAPGVQIIPVEGTAQPQAFARVYLDHKSGTLYMYAAGLHAPAAGKTYQLWLLNDKQQAIPSGTFDVDPRGQASVKRETPQDVGRLVAVAVTDEPAGGSSQPTGTKQLVGKVQ